MSVAGPDVERRSHRIAVANLDAVEQTNAWLALGPRKAVSTLVGALRTALLLADRIVVDRNQVLEGILFVALTPDRLAWHLGLPPGAPLPLTIGLLNPGAAPVLDPGEPAWPTADGRRWAVSHEIAAQVLLNHAAVAADRERVSSPLVALTGDYAGSVVADRPSVNAPPPSRAWDEGDPSLLPPALWSLRDPEVARHLIDEGRRAWTEAMLTGRVEIEEWRSRPIDLGAAFERLRPPGAGVRDLERALIGLEEPDGLTPVCRAHHPGVDEPGRVCGRRHATRRSLLVRWLDGEEVAGLRPASRPASGDDAVAHLERLAAFRWWNQAYYEAICERDDLRLLTLHNVVPTQWADGGLDPAEVARVELAWGLRRPPRAGWRVALERLSRSSGTRTAVGVEGEIVEHLMDFAPHQFVALQQRRVVDPQRLWSAPSNRSMYDLALAVRDLAGERSSRLARLVTTLLRLLALTTFAVTFALRDAGVLPASGALWASLWAVLAVVGGFPWADLVGLFTMSRTGLQSTLRLRDD